MDHSIKAYHLPASLDQAVALLERYAGAARVVGGGTDYFVDDSKDEPGRRPQALVDVTQVEGFDQVREQDGYVVIGCGATHARIVASPVVQVRGTALMESCGLIGGPQVRNVGTLMGNIAHALPAADGTLALMALGGEIAVAEAGPDAGAVIRWMPLEKAFVGPGKSAIDSTRQIIAAARFRPTGAHEGSGFARIMRPQGVALPIMGLACRAQLAQTPTGTPTLETVTIAAGPVAPVPFRARRTEAFLAGRPATEDSIKDAVAVMLGEVVLRTSAHRATSDYRRQVLPVLLRDALGKAIERALTAKA